MYRIDDKLHQLRIEPATKGLIVGKYDQAQAIGRKKMIPIPKPDMSE